jgi:hypothetical protein
MIFNFDDALPSLYAAITQGARPVGSSLPQYAPRGEVAAVLNAGGIG